MGFDALGSRYLELRRDHAAGLMSDEAFRAAVAELRVEDDQGRLWAIDPDSGEWYVLEEGAWREGQPPRSAAQSTVVNQGGPSRGLIIGGAAALGLLLLGCLGVVGYGLLGPGRPLLRLVPSPTPRTPSRQPVCTPPPCATDESYYCPDECPGGCGVICVTVPPSASPTRTSVAAAGPVTATPKAVTPSATAEPSSTTPSASAPTTSSPAAASSTPRPTEAGKGTAEPTTCAIGAWGWFEGALRWSEGARERIGCPTEDVRTIRAASQDFEHGIMVWREDEGLIYVVRDGGGWEAFPDTWAEGMPETDPAIGPPPDGKIQPKRGFGLVWAQQEAVREALGWALNDERACDDAHVQSFERGLGLSCTHDVVPGAKIYVFTFFDDSTYGLYMP